MEETVQEFGRAELGRRLDAFYKELLELASDVTAESIHRTRIESRRMRAVLEAFRDLFPARALDSANREVRRITRMLGAPRESAVNMSLVQELADKCAVEPFCLEYLSRCLASSLKKKKKQLLKKLDLIDPSQLRSRLESLISIIDTGKKRRANGAQKVLFRMHESAIEQTGRVLTNLTASIREFPTLRQFDQVSDEEIHSMRIAAKKGRYTMEIFSSIWPGGLSDRIEKARRFQQVAGKYNDWSVLCRYLDNGVKRLDSPDSVRLAFEIGKMSSRAEMLKKDLKVEMKAVLIDFQESLNSLSFAGKLRADSSKMALSRASRRSVQKKSLADKARGQGVA